MSAFILEASVARTRAANFCISVDSMGSNLLLTQKVAAAAATRCIENERGGSWRRWSDPGPYGKIEAPEPAVREVQMYSSQSRCSDRMPKQQPTNMRISNWGSTVGRPSQLEILSGLEHA